MNNLRQMLKRIISDNGNFVSKEQAEQCLKEVNDICSKNKTYSYVLNAIETTAKSVEETLKRLRNGKTDI